MGEPVATEAQQSPEARLLAAGFVRSMGFWQAPGREQVMSLDAAVAGLDSGAIQPDSGPPMWVQPGVVAMSEEEIDAAADRIFRPPPPPPLPEWAEPWAELVVEQLRPIIRSEVRKAVRAEARRETREPTK